MHFSTIFLPSLLLLLATPSTAKPKFSKLKDAVLLSKVKTLTLRSTDQTTHRRISAIPQLKCLTPRTCAHYKVDIMRCTNQGSDYDDENIQWSCTANIPEYFKLGSTDVICEGYDSPDDPYVLKGSCGVEYRLVLTDKGEEKYGKGGGSTGEASSTAFQTLFFIIFFAVAAWIVYSIWKSLRAARGRGEGFIGNNGGNWGGWGGGGGGDDNDFPRGPPPPYSKYGSTGGQYGRRDGGGWRPGFWTGLGAGGAAGYAAGNAMGGRQNRSSSNSNSAWGSPTRSSSSSSNSSFSNHASTGFGGTSRR